MKLINRIFGIAAALLLVCSCTTVLDTETIVGTWEVDRHLTNGWYNDEDGRQVVSSTYSERDKEKDPDVYTHLTFNSDGTGVMLSNSYNREGVLERNETPFSWSIEDNDLYMNKADGTPLFSANGFDMTLFGSKLFIEKVIKDGDNNFEEKLVCYRIEE